MVFESCLDLSCYRIEAMLFSIKTRTSVRLFGHFQFTRLRNLVLQHIISRCAEFLEYDVRRHILKQNGAIIPAQLEFDVIQQSAEEKRSVMLVVTLTN